MSRNLYRSLTLAALAAALAAGGCSSGPEYGEVEGVVTLDGKPLADVEVTFLPDAAKGTVGPRASCYTDEGGRFRLWSEQSGVSGAVAGKHVVCLSDAAASPPPPESGLKTANGAPYRPRPPRVPQRYTATHTTPLRDVEVRPGKQTINLELNTKDRR